MEPTPAATSKTKKKDPGAVARGRLGAAVRYGTLPREREMELRRALVNAGVFKAILASERRLLERIDSRVAALRKTDGAGDRAAATPPNATASDPAAPAIAAARQELGRLASETIATVHRDLDRVASERAAAIATVVDQHPFLAGLLKTLPAAESQWPIEKRAKWLDLAVAAFELIYADDPAGGSIEVSVRKNAAVTATAAAAAGG